MSGMPDPYVLAFLLAVGMAVLLMYSRLLAALQGAGACCRGYHGTVEMLGKPIGSDRQENKHTYMALMGRENCEKAVEELTQSAKSILCEVFDDAAFLCSLADALSVREK